MKKVYFGLLVLGLFFNSSFGQNPVANNSTYDYFIGACPNLQYFPISYTSSNGIASIDLDPQTPDIQNFFNIAGNIIQSASGSVGITILPVTPGQYQFMYNFVDNSGNISNTATITINIQGLFFSLGPQLSYPTCNNLLGGSLNIPFPSSFPNSSSVTYDVVVYKDNVVYTSFFYTTTNGGDYLLSGLSAGIYVFQITACGGYNVLPTGNVFEIIQLNPIDGLITANYNDYNNDGLISPGDVYNCQYSLTNSSTSCTIQGINVESIDGSNNIFGQTITSLAPNSTNSTNFTGKRIITQNDINQGTLIIASRVTLEDPIYYSKFIFLNIPLNIPNGIKLNAFLDTNNNGIQDNNESDYTNGTFGYQINSGENHSVNTDSGELNLYETNPANVYNLNYNIIPNNSFCGSQYTVATTSYNNITVANGSGITTYNFPITVVPCSDVSVNLSSNQPRPGFSHYTTVIYKNEGNQNDVSGTITYTKNITESIINLPFGAVATATGFTYNYYLQPGQTRYITVETQIPTIPTVSLGQLLTNSVTITPTDANMPNNSATITQAIVGSLDPNDKTENHGRKILHSSFTSNEYLTYTIRFENTGTAEAINIRVNDVLESKLDETSIRMVASSHPYILDRVGSTLNWKFDGVNLPPSSPASTTIGHGYIVFQVKPKAGYAVGDIITNIANIYFDFNPAIVTEPCITEFVSTLATSNFIFENFSFSPNPVTNFLKIANDSAIDRIEVSSILGQKVMEKSVNDLHTEIDMSQLTNGIYFVKVRSDGNEKTVKIVKQ
jgi:uncharacterized repeat protein (TIGR01451 family)